LNLITGQLKATQGRVHLFGVSPTLENDILKRVGLCPAMDLLQTNVTGFDWVQYLLELQGFDRVAAAEKANQALDLVELDEARHRSIGGYSRGMKQRCKLAQAIAHDPDLLILDEPFAGVDPVGRHNLSEIFRGWVEQGKSLLVASHVLHEVEAICESFLLIRDGRLLASGSAYEVHSLLANVPNRIEFKCSQPKKMAEVLLSESLVDAIELDEQEERVVVTTLQPARLYEQLPVLSEQGIEIREMRSGEDSLQAVFDSLFHIHRDEI
jgi:ABC-2 type transport system ATP-binding protein